MKECVWFRQIVYIQLYAFIKNKAAIDTKSDWSFLSCTISLTTHKIEIFILNYHNISRSRDIITLPGLFYIQNPSSANPPISIS